MNGNAEAAMLMLTGMRKSMKMKTRKKKHDQTAEIQVCATVVTVLSIYKQKLLH